MKTFEGEADAPAEGLPGHLVFHVSTLPHSKFVRNHNDLTYKSTITLLEALTGFTQEIRHLDGHIVTVKRTVVTKPGILHHLHTLELTAMTGHVEMVENEGMPVYGQSDRRGRLFIEYTVQFPDTITEHQAKGVLYAGNRFSFV